MVSFFVVLSVLLFVLAFKRQSNIRKDFLFLAAGLSCGMAILTKQTAGLLVAGNLVFYRNYP